VIYQFKKKKKEKVETGVLVQPEIIELKVRNSGNKNVTK